MLPPWHLGRSRSAGGCDGRCLRGPCRDGGRGAAPEAIRAALANWTRAFNDGNAAEVCAIFAADLIADYRGQPERGHDAICNLLRKSLTDPKTAYRYSLKVDEILVAGDLAVVRLVWTLEAAPKNGTAIRTITEPGIDVFRRQRDAS
jgi:uncharacterized protein (TIGR02246 family)